MWKLSSYGRHIRIQDGRRIIRHAVFHERHMSVITEKVVITPFRLEGSNGQFHDDGCIAGLFQCHCAYQDASPRIIVPDAYV